MEFRAGEAKGYCSFCRVIDALSGNGRHLGVWETADETRPEVIEAEVMDVLSNYQQEQHTGKAHTVDLIAAVEPKRNYKLQPRELKVLVTYLL